MNAFPRLMNLQQQLTERLKVENFKNNLLLEMLQYPRAIFYKANGYSNIDSMYLKCERHHETIIPQEIINTHDRSGAIICFLEADFGHLSNMDIECLHKINKELPDNWINKAIFVVNETSLPEFHRSYHVLSVEICRVLDVELNDIIQRIFGDKKHDILDRMSLYCESLMLERHICVNQTLQSLNTQIKEAIHWTESHWFKLSSERILLAGPLEDDILKKQLRIATRSYIWEGPQYTSAKSMVEKAKKEIAEHACKELATEIGSTLIRHLKKELPHDGSQVFSDIFKFINLNNFEMTVIEGLIIVLVTLFFGWYISVIVIYFRGAYLDSENFRREVADKMFAEITKYKAKILSDILDNFRKRSLVEYRHLKFSLDRFSDDFNRCIKEETDLNTRDRTVKAFKALAERNELITDFKFENNTLHIFARGGRQNHEDVKEYVKTYFLRDVKTIIHMRE
ncbi:uncharacterized protein [Mytilus edulis]|uniref:uncharacterized protein n=1 Tax=Mytilus edulis TaxID=6550 RepID=UPI0039F0DE80